MTSDVNGGTSRVVKKAGKDTGLFTLHLAHLEKKWMIWKTLYFSHCYESIVISNVEIDFTWNLKKYRYFIAAMIL